jgi:hypothetical protein
MVGVLRLGCAALGGAILAILGVRHVQRELGRDDVTGLPLRFLSVCQLYAAADLPERRAEALVELTNRLGYTPSL